MKTLLILQVLILGLSATARAGIDRISLPVDSQDSSCAPRDQGVWDATAPFDPFNSLIGIGHIISEPGLGYHGFVLHDHAYVADYIPDPAREVVTYHFDQATVVRQLEMIQHANGVTRVEGFVGDAPDAMTSIGNVFGPSGDVTGGGVLPEGECQTFDFANTTVAGTWFRFVVTKTSLNDGFAFYRAYPCDADGQRIAGTLPPHLISLADIEVQEDAGMAAFTVTLTPAASEDVTLQYATAANTADATADYTTTTGTLTIEAGHTTATLEVPIINDSDPEFAETFFLNLTNPAGAGAAIERHQAVCTIAESDIGLLEWDDGTADDGSATFTTTCESETTYWFKIQAMPANSGGWRTVLRSASGNADLYAAAGFIPTISYYAHKSDRTSGDDGWVLRPDQYTAGNYWYFAVHAAAGTTFTLFSGEIYVQDMGTLAFDDTDSNSQYDIGEAALPSGSGAVTINGEGMRFFKARIPVGTPAWSLWLNGDTRQLAVRTDTVPYPISSSYYHRIQAGRMLLVPPYLGTGTDTYYLSVTGNPGDAIELDSRIQEVQDIAFDTTLADVSVAGPPFRVYRTQVPVDQIAWDVSTTGVSGDPNLAVRHADVAGELDNHAFSAAAGSATDSVTLVPDFLTNGTWFITVWGTAPYRFTLRSGNPNFTPINYTDTIVNDQPGRSGWRFFSLTNIPAQVGSLGWELELSGQVPGTQIALRKNKVPGRWQYRWDGGQIYDTGVTYTDFSSTTGFMQRPGHQSDIWYVGIFLPQVPLGAFTLDVHPVVPPTVGFNGSNTTLNDLAPGRWSYVRIDVPSGALGWDLRLADISGPLPQLVVRRDVLPDAVLTSGWPGWYSYGGSWPSGASVNGMLDWTGRSRDAADALSFDDLRQVLGTGRPLEAGTYYVGIHNSNTTTATSCTLQSRGIGNGQAYPVADLDFNTGTVEVAGLIPREAAYFKVTVPEGAASWEITLNPSVGEMLLAVRRDAIPDFSSVRGGDPQTNNTYDSRAVEMQKTGAERYVMLPLDGQSTLLAGDYYIAVVAEGVNPADDSHTGTGTCTGQLTSHGELSVTHLGTATPTGIGDAVTLAAGQVKAYSFTVPAGTASLEVRLDNRVGTPWLSVIPGDRLPRPYSPLYYNGYERYGYGGGQETGIHQNDNLITLPNPTPGSYRMVVRAAASPTDPNAFSDASADLVVVANIPVPVTFNGGGSAVSHQAPTAWRYFEVVVPDGIHGWDARLENVSAGTPQMVVCRGTLPSAVSTGDAWPWGWPSYSNTWPESNRWNAGTDWTGRIYQADGVSVEWQRMVLSSGRPLEPGTYYVGVYNADPTNAASYTFMSRGIGVTEIPFSGGNATLTGLPVREAAYFKVTVPPNTPSWEITLDPSEGEMLLAIQRGSIPDFDAARGGDIQSDYYSREVKVQKSGPERYVLLPPGGQDVLVAGDYYVAVMSEGQSPADGQHTGTGSCSGTLTSRGALLPTHLGTASVTPTVLPVTLQGGQVAAYDFTVAAGTSSAEIRLDNRFGEPWMSLLPGTRSPHPFATSYWGYRDIYGFGGGETTGYVGDESLYTLPNPVPGNYRLMLHASSAWNDTACFPVSGGDLTITRNEPVDLAFNGGTTPVSGQLQTSWRFFRVVVPNESDVLGWDVRVRNVTGGNPQLTIRRDALPDRMDPNNLWPAATASSPAWPSGATLGGTWDWTGRPYDAGSGEDIQYRRLIAASGRPLEPGTYYIGIYNIEGAGEAGYVIESRSIGGGGRTIGVTEIPFAGGPAANITRLPPREAAYFRVTVPSGTPNWEFTLDQTAGELLMLARRGTIPDFSAAQAGIMQATDPLTNREVRVSRIGPERYVLLPMDNQDELLQGDYYIAVVSEGDSPADANHTGTDPCDGVLTSNGGIAVTDLGTATAAGIGTPVSLLAGQLKAYAFTVAPGTSRVDIRLDNRIGGPLLSVIPGNRTARPFAYGYYYYGGYEVYGTGGGQTTGGLDIHESLVSIGNPLPGPYSVVVRAAGLTYYSASLEDAQADLVIQTYEPPPPDQADPLNFAASENGNGQSHTDTRQLADTHKAFYAVAVPQSLDGSPVIGWKILMDRLQGNATLRVFKTWGNPQSGITLGGNIAVVVPPFLTPGDTWYIEVQAVGLTNYTITSEPVVLRSPAWTMPLGHNSQFGDTGDVDLGQNDWHFYAVDIPEDNAGLLRTELQAINGDPNLYIREDGAPTTDHTAIPPWGAPLYQRSLTNTGTEYGNWVPLDGRLQHQLPPGRWHFGVKGAGTSNARYRLILSTGQVTEIDLTDGSAPNQVLVGKDWRYYRCVLPPDAPETWNLTFSQHVGDVVMWLRDTVPPGNRATGDETRDYGSYWDGLVSWAYDAKNQGPYAASGYDDAGTYAFHTPPLRPGQVYYVGFRATSDASFSFGSTTGGGTIGTIPSLDFYNGTVTATVPAGGQLIYQVSIPPEAIRWRHSSVHGGNIRVRIEQGTLPTFSGSVHYEEPYYYLGWNIPLTAWPMLPDQTCYVMLANDGTTDEAVTFTMDGRNSANDDEDGDGLPDGWENLYFGNYWTYGPLDDPDGDSNNNLLEYHDGTDPSNPLSAKYRLFVHAGSGVVTVDPRLDDYAPGQQVTLTAQTDAGVEFLGWTGDATGTDNPLLITMDGNKDLTAEFRIGMTYQSWGLSRFTPDELANPAISGPDANPARDGIVNLLKYAFHLDPFTAYAGDARTLTPGTGLHGLPCITRTAQDGILRVEFLQRIGTSGLSYAVQFGSGLTTGGADGWQQAAASPTITPTGNPNWNRVVVHDIPPPGSARRFARVRVTEEP